MKKLFRIKLLLISIIIAFSNIALAQQPPHQFEGFNLQGYDDKGNKSWDVKGDKADMSGKDVKLSNVDANSYGGQNMNVKAQTGIINQESGEMRLEKDVVITSQDGQQLMTDSLNWYRDKDLVTTEDDVMITDERMTATGKGLEANPKGKKAQIQENVKVTVDTDLKSSTDKKVTITSDGPMVIDQKESKAIFQQNVVAVQDNQVLKADRMEVYFDPKMNTINQLICLGNVVIEQGENKSFAEKAVYNAATKKLTLSGRPKLVFITEGQNAITSFGN